MKAKKKPAQTLSKTTSVFRKNISQKFPTKPQILSKLCWLTIFSKLKEIHYSLRRHFDLLADVSGVQIRLSCFVDLVFYSQCAKSLMIKIINRQLNNMYNFYDRSRPSAQVCLESLWIHRASIPRSSASRPKPIATNRLVDFIERKKLQVYMYSIKC